MHMDMTESTNSQKNTQSLQRELAQAKIEVAGLQVELAKARQDYNNLFEGAGDSIFLVDPRTFRIVATNFHAARRLGYGPGELAGMNLSDIEVPIENGQRPIPKWESSVSGSKVYECLHRNRNGNLIPVEVSSSLVKVDGRQVIQSFVRNIELRRRIEREREELIADLDSFADTVAHDLKSPLSIVIGYAYYLEEKWRSLDAAEVDQLLEIFKRNTERLINIIDELLLFATVRKQNEIEKRPLDTNLIIAEVEARLANLIQTRKAEIIKPASYPGAISYAPWVEEIWSNYISNAIKYGGTPPRVTIGAALEPGNMVHFWVADNGNGIDEAKLGQLFEQFNRLGETRIEGHGLGLSIVKRIVEKLGGTVSVTSEVGQGSCFGFTLPAQLRGQHD